jgi:hypothetical protein
MTFLAPAENSRGVLRPHAGAARELEARILETAQLMDRRGYGVSLEQFSRLLYGGSAPEAEVAAALAHLPHLSMSEGLVIQTDRRGETGGMRSRQATHIRHAVDAQALANDFAGRLMSSCPLVKSVSLTGSLASGGFDPGDDVDLNIVAANGAKYTVYFWALWLSALTSLRNRAKPTDEMSPIPFLPKIICVNVVWEERQVRPLLRQDKWIAYELLMHRPILGSANWRAVLAQNLWMEEHFPQVFEPGFVGEDAQGAQALAGKRRAGSGFFGFLARHPMALSAAEAVSRLIVISVHKLISLSRANKPEARERETFVNLVKRPYSVYDVPGREAPVPSEALRPRGRDAPANP